MFLNKNISERMFKMKKTNLFLAGALAASLMLTACGSKKETIQTSKSDLSGYPIKTDTQLTYWSAITGNVSASTSNLGETPFAKELAEKTGVKVKYIHPPLGQENEQFSLLVASNELPDMIQWDWLTALGGPDASIGDKVIVKLNDYFSKYAPNLTKVLADNKDFDKMVKSDNGDYYVFPFLKGDEMLLTTSGMIVRQDWLDDLGLDAPKTVDDWENVLTAFRDKKGAVAPLTVKGVEYEVLFRLLNTHIEFYRENGKVVYGPLMPEYKQAVIKLKEWFDKGLLDKNFASVDNTILSANMLNGKSGATFGTGGGCLGKWLQTAQSTGSKVDLAGIPMYAADGKSPSHFMYASLPYSPWGSVAVSTACKDIPLAVKYLDYGYGEEGYMLNNFGIEGKSYNMVDGYPTFTRDITNNPDGLTMSQAMSRYVRSCDSGPFVQAKEYIEQYYSMPQQKKALESWTFGTDETLSTQMPQITMTADESDEFSTLYAEIKKVRDTMTTSFITGVVSIDKYDEFIQKLHQLNVDKAIELEQSALDRYNSRK